MERIAVLQARTNNVLNGRVSGGLTRPAASLSEGDEVSVGGECDEKDDFFGNASSSDDFDNLFAGNDKEVSLFERTKKSLPKPAEPVTEDEEEKEELGDSDLDDFFGNEEEEPEEKPGEKPEEPVKEEPKPKEAKESKEALSDDYSYSYSDYSYSYSDYSYSDYSYSDDENTDIEPAAPASQPEVQPTAEPTAEPVAAPEAVPAAEVVESAPEEKKKKRRWFGRK